MSPLRKCFVFLSVLVCDLSSARTITYEASPVPVEIKYGRATVLRFDAKVTSIQNAEKFEVGPLNDQAPNYAEMSVKPRITSGSETVNFHLADGNVVMLKISVVSDERAQSLETFHSLHRKQNPNAAAPKDLLSAEDPEEAEEGSERKMELMKALILGKKHRGYQVRSVNQPLKTGLQGVEATLDKVYTGKDFNGYIFRIVNTARNSKYEIDIKRLRIGEPNLALLSQIDRDVIEPAASGKNISMLTIVALPSSLSKDIVLPVTWAKKEEK